MYLTYYVPFVGIQEVIETNSSSYNFVTAGRVEYHTTYQSLRIQLVQNAPDDGQVRSETCRANISAE